MDKIVYNLAKSELGSHITLDQSVPPDVGCAEAVSFVFKNSGVAGFPDGGFAGTAALFGWAKGNLEQIADPEFGALVISPSGQSSKGVPHGHTGIIGMPGLMGNGQTGIMSNDSDTGLFMEKYTVDTWRQLFCVALGFPAYYFRVK